MDEAATVPLRKKAIAFLAYAVLNLIFGMIVLVVMAVNFEAYLPKGQASVLALLAGSQLCAVPFTLWCRHRYIHADEREQQRKLAEKKSQRAPAPGSDGESVATAAKAAFVIGGIAVGLYVAVLVVAAMPISVAIVFGAVIIGFCILAGSRAL